LIGQRANVELRPTLDERHLGLGDNDASNVRWQTGS
jgi:hypothetical protein